MSTFLLTTEPVFPHPSLADSDGLLAIGGDLTVTRLCNAYSKGIFPWYGQGSPILWWCPEPRLILYPGKLHIPKSLRKVINSCKFRITSDRAFERIIENCARTPRPGGEGTWLVPEMIDAYMRMHEAGFAHSFEAWQEGCLAGGIYGVAMGKAFFGESMFYHKPDASKTAMVHLVSFLESRGFHFMDCQQTTRHMLRFGACEIPRNRFLNELDAAVRKKGKPEKWNYSA